LHIISRRSIKTVIKLTLATLMHSKIKDFNFIRIISRISKKQLLQRASKVLSNHIKIISAVNMSIGTKRHMKPCLLALLALPLSQLHLPARLQLNESKHKNP